ncbi:MAG: phosphotransferase [Erythrobacter sp.]|uniref:aminoglycoside phosphotransferase family protein n=1 Tax=Erythrobacter sp. TaxID=1042 RepID=UPI0032F0631A
MTQLPEGLHDFLRTAGWGDAAIHPLPGDASFRRYYRLRAGDRGAMLMHAPPPHEDPVPFLDVAQWLAAHSLRAPAIHHADPEAGWVLLEDFGDDRMRDWLDARPEDEEAAYEAAVHALADLHDKPPGPFAPYDMDTYLGEVRLFTQWYASAAAIEVDEAGFEAAWREVLEPVVKSPHNGVTVLRDYHAENIMLLGGRPGAPQGLIDFQDALVGHAAYDLVSLLQDARRDVDPGFADMMLETYREERHRRGVDLYGGAGDFIGEYATLGAQRNTKIVGIFTRLAKRDGKPRYLAMIPRVWKLLEADLDYPALRPVARWFDANIPADLRGAHGGEIA